METRRANLEQVKSLFRVAKKRQKKGQNFQKNLRGIQFKISKSVVGDSTLDF